MHGCGGHVWLQLGVCVVAGGSMHGCGGVCGCGGCMVAGGQAWLQRGAGVVAGGVHGGRWGVACVGYDEIRSMSGRYASYWNAFLLFLSLVSIMFRQYTN